MRGAAANTEDSDDDEEEEERIDTGTKITKASEGFSDKYWWAFIHLISFLSEMLGAIEYWAQGCKCHPRKLRDMIKTGLV